MQRHFVTSNPTIYILVPHRIFGRIGNNFYCLSFSTTGMHCLPATSHAANEYRFRCFTSCTISKKNSYVIAKGLRNFQYSLASRCFSSGFISITYHLEKSDRGWTCRVRLASNRGWNRDPRPLLSPPSPCSLARLKSEPTRLRS